jgi:N-acetylmuramoyl-L-alanine amidase
MIQFRASHAGNFRAGRGGKKIKYIVIHYTANDGDTAAGNASYFARELTKTSAHYFVDEKEAWQSVKDTDTAYAVGAAAYVHADCRNDNSISIEMCSRKGVGKVYYIPAATVERTAELTQNLMAKFGVPAANVLRHYDVTGKRCPEPFVRLPGLWADFKKKLEGSEEDMKYYESLPDVPSWGKATVEKLTEKKLLSGDSAGKLRLSEDMLRILVILDRAKAFG